VFVHCSVFSPKFIVESASKIITLVPGYDQGLREVAEGWQDRLVEHAPGAQHLRQRQPRVRPAAQQDRRVRRARQRNA
jgi:hypothetical protein